MNQQEHDGGPAFPIVGACADNQFNGMTLRDYFAVHSTQPGAEEICKVAGVGYDGIRVYRTADDEVGVGFNEWWRSLLVERMCELSAKVRFLQADAMLAARSRA